MNKRLEDFLTANNIYKQNQITCREQGHRTAYHSFISQTLLDKCVKNTATGCREELFVFKESFRHFLERSTFV